MKTKILLILILLVIYATVSCRKNDSNPDPGSGPTGDSMLVRNGMVLYLDFENNLRDHSGNNNNAIAFGTTFLEESDSNHVLYLNGVSDYLQILNSTSLNPLNAMTISMWFSANDYTGTGFEPLVVKPNTSHTAPYYQYILGIGGDYPGPHPHSVAFNMDLKGINTGINSGTNGWYSGLWYNIQGVYDGVSMRLYINTVLKDSVAATGNMVPFNTDLYVGTQPNLGVFTPCTIDNIRIYNRALSKEERLKIFSEKL